MVYTSLYGICIIYITGDSENSLKIIKDLTMKFRNLTIPFNARNDRQTGINVKDKVKKLLIPIIIEGEHLIEKNVYFNIKKFRK